MGTAYVNISDEDIQVNTDKDSIVIVDAFATIRGGRSLDITGFTPKVIQAGHVIIRETATDNYKPMPATPASDGGIATFGSVTAGSGYTNGTYEDVPLLGGSGSGALATIVISGAALSTITKTTAGKNYAVADVLTFAPGAVGGTGSGASVPVATIASVTAAFGALPAGHTYAGIMRASALTKRAFAAILTQGTVNPNAMPYGVSSILTALKAALPFIDFRAD